MPIALIVALIVQLKAYKVVTQNKHDVPFSSAYFNNGCKIRFGIPDFVILIRGEMG